MDESLVSSGTRNAASEKSIVTKDTKTGKLAPSVNYGKSSYSHTTKTKSISSEELAKYFHMPINNAAKELGICATVLKEVCRRKGIQRWPHRKLKALDRLIEKYEREQSSALDQGFYQNEIRSLRQKKESILKNCKRRGSVDSPTPKGDYQFGVGQHPHADMDLDQNGQSMNGSVARKSWHQMHGAEHNMYGDCSPCDRGEEPYSHVGYYGQPPSMIQMRQMGYHPQRSGGSHGQMMNMPPSAGMHVPQMGAGQVRTGHSGGGMNMPRHAHPPSHQNGQVFEMGMPGAEMYSNQCMSCPPSSHGHHYMHGMVNPPGMGSYQYHPQMPYGTMVYETEQAPYPMVGYAMGDPQQNVVDGMHAWPPHAEEGKPMTNEALMRNTSSTKEEQRSTDNGSSHKKSRSTMPATIDTRKSPKLDGKGSETKNVDYVRLDREAKNSKKESSLETEPAHVEVEQSKDTGRAERTDSEETDNSAEEDPPMKESAPEVTEKEVSGKRMQVVSSDKTQKQGDVKDERRRAQTSKAAEEETEDMTQKSKPLGKERIEELLTSLQVTLWIMDPLIKCVSRDGPANVAYHGENLMVGDSVIEQVKRNKTSTDEQKSKVLEPYFEARAGRRVERTFWHEGRKFLQIFSPVDSERSMSLCSTSSMCLEISST